MLALQKSLPLAVLSVLAARLCCIVPFVAVVSGITGSVTIFSFLEPYRPFLILFSVSILAFGFYHEYKPKNLEAMKPCCQANAKKKSKRNRKFLWTMTIISALLFSFPFYSGYFIKGASAQTIENKNCKTVQLKVSGMSCQGCANNIMLHLYKTDGIIKDTVIFKTETATITFDTTKISHQQVISEIDNIGFTAKPK